MLPPGRAAARDRPDDHIDTLGIQPSFLPPDLTDPEGGEVSGEDITLFKEVESAADKVVEVDGNEWGVGGRPARNRADFKDPGPLGPDDDCGPHLRALSSSEPHRSQHHIAW